MVGILPNLWVILPCYLWWVNDAQAAEWGDYTRCEFPSNIINYAGPPFSQLCLLWSDTMVTPHSLWPLHKPCTYWTLSSEELGREITYQCAAKMLKWTPTFCFLFFSPEDFDCVLGVICFLGMDRLVTFLAYKYRTFAEVPHVSLIIMPETKTFLKLFLKMLKDSFVSDILKFYKVSQSTLQSHYCAPVNVKKFLVCVSEKVFKPYYVC